VASEVDVSQKAKAHKKTSPKLIAIAVLIIVFILGAMLGGALTRHGTTTTTTQTTQIQTTVTQGADVAKYLAASQAITSEDLKGGTQWENKLHEFNNGQISKNDLLSALRERKENLKQLTESILRLQPPPAFAEVHAHEVKARLLAYAAIEVFEEGLIQNNPSLIDEANALLNEATNETKAANDILDSLISQRTTTVMVQTAQTSVVNSVRQYLESKYSGLLDSVGIMLFSLDLATLPTPCGSFASNDFMIGYCFANGSSGIVWNFLHGSRGMVVLMDYPTAMGTWQSIEGGPQFSKTSTSVLPVKMNGAYGHAYVFVEIPKQ
jgi:hypothetical protein